MYPEYEYKHRMNTLLAVVILVGLAAWFFW